jgi:hypothetical protein
MALKKGLSSTHASVKPSGRGGTWQCTERKCPSGRNDGRSRPHAPHCPSGIGPANAAHRGAAFASCPLGGRRVQDMRPPTGPGLASWPLSCPSRGMPLRPVLQADVGRHATPQAETELPLPPRPHRPPKANGTPQFARAALLLAFTGPRMIGPTRGLSAVERRLRRRARGELCVRDLGLCHLRRSRRRQSGPAVPEGSQAPCPSDRPVVSAQNRHAQSAAGAGAKTA